MTADVLMFLTIRAAHVAVAAVWIGSTVFNLFLLAPALDDSGAAGGQVMAHVNRRGLHIYMMTLGISTVLTGVYLLWRFTGGFDTGVIATHAGIAFGIGGAAGIAAGVIGGGVVGRSAAAMTGLMASAAGLPEGPAKGALFNQAASLKHRMNIGSRVVLALQASALVLMAVGHYV
jgi:hypothetical protein